MSDDFDFQSMGDQPSFFSDEAQGIVFKEGEIVAERFKILAPIGGGGMGLVYKVEDQHMDGQIKALKVILPSLVESEQAQKRFISEAHIAQKLSHPNIVTTYDLHKHENKRFITMELLEGHIPSASSAPSAACRTSSYSGPSISRGSSTHHWIHGFSSTSNGDGM